MNLEVLDKYREKKDAIFGTIDGQKHGLFWIPVRSHTAPLKVLCSPMGVGEWEHVSVSLPNRCPKWTEMCKVKDLFWDDKDTVVQFHPKKSEYVDNCKFCLHLWKKTNEEHELPPSHLVGIK